MPNCDFYAVGEDHRKILEFVLSSDGCAIYELASRYEQPLQRFRTLEDFEKRFKISSWEAGSPEGMLLQLHPERAGGSVEIRKVALDPDKCNGATFRYNSAGWGLIQLYLEPVRNGLIRNSHTNHNSQERARAWSDTDNDLGRVEDWNWAEVASFSKRLNRYIKKLSVLKSGSRIVLPQAAKLHREGAILG